MRCTWPPPPPSPWSSLLVVAPVSSGWAKCACTSDNTENDWLCTSCGLVIDVRRHRASLTWSEVIRPRRKSFSSFLWLSSVQKSFTSSLKHAIQIDKTCKKNEKWIWSHFFQKKWNTSSWHHSDNIPIAGQRALCVTARVWTPPQIPHTDHGVFLHKAGSHYTVPTTASHL